MSDPSSQPTQPLTDADLARMGRELTAAVEGDGKWYLTTCAPRDMRRLLDEVDRLRAEYASLSKVHTILNDAHEYKSIKVYELTDRLDALELKLKSNPVHFVRLGRGDAACGEGLPGIVPWDPARLDFSSPTLTTRPEKATCTECIAALGLDQDGSSNA